MLLKYILELIIFLVGNLLSILNSLIPNIDALSIMSTAVNSLLGISTQVQNFMFFIFGDSLYAFATILPTVLILKFLIVPIASFIRKIFIFGGRRLIFV